MQDLNSPFAIKLLMVYEGINNNTAAARAIKTLKKDLEDSDVRVEVAESFADAGSIIVSDPTLQCILLKIDEKIRNAVPMPNRF